MSADYGLTQFPEIRTVPVLRMTSFHTEMTVTIALEFIDPV
jgi:hypothetical protein